MHRSDPRPSGDLTASEGQELSLTSKVTLSPGAMPNNDQDWAFTGVANTAIVKAIADPTEVPAGGFTPGTSVTYTLTLTNAGPIPPPASSRRISSPLV